MGRQNAHSIGKAFSLFFLSYCKYQKPSVFFFSNFIQFLSAIFQEEGRDMLHFSYSLISVSEIRSIPEGRPEFVHPDRQVLPLPAVRLPPASVAVPPSLQLLA